AVGEVARGLLELDGDERNRVLAPDVREDAGLRAEQPPVAERVVGVGLDDPLVGADGARVDVDADESAADGGGDGQRRERVVLEHVTAERGLGERPPDLGVYRLHTGEVGSYGYPLHVL